MQEPKACYNLDWMKDVHGGLNSNLITLSPFVYLRQACDLPLTIVNFMFFTNKHDFISCLIHFYVF